MKKKKYLSLYYKWMENQQRLPSNGLCNLFKHDELFKLIDPDQGGMCIYWGVDGDRSANEFTRYDCDYIHYAFTPFRQTIVLFLAAMNGEI